MAMLFLVTLIRYTFFTLYSDLSGSLILYNNQHELWDQVQLRPLGELQQQRVL